MVESSVKAVSRPVIDRLPVNVNQLDDFACRQLDKVSSTIYLVRMILIQAFFLARSISTAIIRR